MIPKMGYYSRHPEKYSERFRYEYDRYAINLMKKTGRITTEGFGMENLPKDGGYVMFSNHQGKYDALGIMHTHDTPCSVVMDDARSHGPLVKQFIDLVEGKRLKLDNLKQAAGIIKEVTEEVKKGRKFIIFRPAVMSIGMEIMLMNLSRCLKAQGGESPHCSGCNS